MIVDQLQYSGDTPIESTLIVEQTGPMQITVRGGGHFTTSGMVERVVIVTPENIDTANNLVAQGLASWMPDNERIRIWAVDDQGVPIAPSTTYTLPADIVINIITDPLVDKMYKADFGLYNGTPDILCRSQLSGEVLPDEPVGWQLIHALINQFMIPIGTTILDVITIPVYTTRPGFPGGEGVVWGRNVDGSLWQRGVS